MNPRTRRPPHIYLDDTWYIITGVTHERKPLLSDPRAKDCLRDTLKHAAERQSISLRAWVILNDHYHLLLKSRLGAGIPIFIKYVHGSTSRTINLLAGVEQRRVWFSYWDTCIRTHSGFWTRFNYIHFNPVKHGYVHHPGDWEYSSFDYYAQTKGQGWLDDCISRYTISDTLAGDNFPDRTHRRNQTSE